MPKAAFARHLALKEKIRAAEPTLGVFVKTPAIQSVEILGSLDVDFMVLDAEHGPFDRSALDQCLLAARSTETPTLVRVPDLNLELILQVLDLGAAGIVAPHILSAEHAERAVQTTRYQNGLRGFSPSGRSGGYGAMNMADYRAASDASSIVIGQIEDSDGVTNITDIASVNGIDALLIGRADLAISLGTDAINNERVTGAVERICTAGQDAGRPLGMFLPNTTDVSTFQEKGVSLFIIETDQSLLRSAASSMTNSFRSALENRNG